MLTDEQLKTITSQDDKVIYSPDLDRPLEWSQTRIAGMVTVIMRHANDFAKNYDCAGNVLYAGKSLATVLTVAAPFFFPGHDADNPNFLGLLNALVKVYSDSRIPDNVGIIGLEAGDTANYRCLVFESLKLEAV